MIEPRSWATCPRCERPMQPGTSCCDCPWRQDGRVIPPIRFGAERPEPSGEFCRDCNTPRGGAHHYNCDFEQCPHDRQAVACDRCEPLEVDPYYQPPRCN
jgi:hypothetical protein